MDFRNDPFFECVSRVNTARTRVYLIHTVELCYTCVCNSFYCREVAPPSMAVFPHMALGGNSAMRVRTHCVYINHVIDHVQSRECHVIFNPTQRHHDHRHHSLALSPFGHMGMGPLMPFGHSPFSMMSNMMQNMDSMMRNMVSGCGCFSVAIATA